MSGTRHENIEAREWVGSPMGAKPTILVVEDDALLRMHAAGLLEENGFGVVEAENADAALKLMETRDDVRLLFTDIQMPGSCDGMELARQVHARWPNVLLVITSGQIKPAQAEIPDDGRFVGKPSSERPARRSRRSDEQRWMTDREAQLEAGLVANAAIRVQAEHLIAAYVAQSRTEKPIINDLVARAVQRRRLRRIGGLCSSRRSRQDARPS
jgi:CheY-like chemotaxis protein